MHIQINTDSTIQGDEQLAAHVKSVVESALSRFIDQISRVEIHLSDENSLKTGQNDKRCMIEARLKAHRPIAVTHQDATLNQAVHGAAVKMKKSIENLLGRASKTSGD